MGTWNVNFDDVIRAIEDGGYTGFCLACGAEQDGCEPDMVDGECEACGEFKVHGAEEILIMTA